jgi:hypothetical protein
LTKGSMRPLAGTLLSHFTNASCFHTYFVPRLLLFLDLPVAPPSALPAARPLLPPLPVPRLPLQVPMSSAHCPNPTSLHLSEKTGVCSHPLSTMNQTGSNFRRVKCCRISSHHCMLMLFPNEC